MSESIWRLMQAAFQTIGPHYQDFTGAHLEKYGYEGGDWYTTYVAYCLQPEPLTAVTLNQLTPFSHPQRATGLLAQAADHGLLEDVDDYEYILTAKGRESMAAFFDQAWQAIGTLAPLPPEQMERLAGLLERVVTASVAAPEPAAKPQLQLSRQTAPAADAPPMVRIDQSLTDLLRYRDDAHNAAWAGFKISGAAWEAFTLFWRDEVKSLAELAQNRENRGFSTADYADALNELVQRGWLKEEDGRYQVTRFGRSLRDDAETKTDRYFEAGLAALSDDEVEELKALLTRLKDELTIPEPEAEPA